MQQVIVDEIVTTMHAVDGGAVPPPRTLQQIIRKALEAYVEMQAHERRVEDELRLDGARTDRQPER